MARNWNEETDLLGNYWKPEPGKYEIVFLDDGEDGEATFDDKVVKRVTFTIEVLPNKRPVHWSITKGTTQNSLWGQICLVARNKGKIVGEKITLLVKGKGKEVSYTIEEALPLMNVKEEQV